MKIYLFSFLALASCLAFASYYFYQKNRTNALVWIEGGIFTRGKNLTKRPDEAPEHKVEVSGFYYQETLVTLSQFKAFVDQTGYTTTAEKKGFCLISYEGMEDWKWEKKEGANFLHPFGKNSEVEVASDTPVVCVSYLDAKAYCEYLGMRLPTEAEWEYAARAGSLSRFPWGEDPTVKGRFMLNFWQGEDHKNANSQDGNKYLSRVRAYPPNKWGIYDSVGNVWQFTDDYYHPMTYPEAYYHEKKEGKPIKDPKGWATGEKKVTRGGSWWCSEKTCNGYGLHFRGKIRMDSPFNNNGFRCLREK